AFISNRFIFFFLTANTLLGLWVVFACLGMTFSRENILLKRASIGANEGSTHTRTGLGLLRTISRKRSEKSSPARISRTSISDSWFQDREGLLFKIMNSSVVNAFPLIVMDSLSVETFVT